MYCFSFSLNFLYLSLASVCSDAITKTAPKYSTSHLKFLTDDVYAGKLNCPSHLPHPWWPPLPVRPPRPCPCPPLLEVDSHVSEAQVIVASLLSLSLLPVEGESVSVSGVILFYSCFLNTIKLTLLS